MSYVENSKFEALSKDQRKKILLLSDDIRMHSGVATMAQELVIGTSHYFNWVTLGAGIKHPDIGKVFDLSESINQVTGLSDSYVRLIPNEGYGNPDIVRNIILVEKPDAIMIFTDPRYWIWFFEMEREIRTKIPVIYYNIWDDFPAPLYNKKYYESVDTLLAISKQTKLINELVLAEDSISKVIKYVPHGINSNLFFPLERNSNNLNTLQTLKKSIFQNKDIHFTVFFNSRNLRRKSPGDIVLGYRIFCDMIGKEQAKKCALLMHTEVSSEHGTDLQAVVDTICDKTYCNVFFSRPGVDKVKMNLLYNIADVTVLGSSNEGWGLSLTESMMAGTMIIANSTGGMQDQLRFRDHEGNWYDPTPDVPSNHRGTYKEHGDWGIPIFPSNRSLVGSPPTPYIFDDRCNPEDIAQAIKTVWELSPEERTQRGLKGREWVMSEESGMAAHHMCNRFIEGVVETFERFEPRNKYDLIKIQDKKQILAPHKLTGY